jgi:hypothetical protein
MDAFTKIRLTKLLADYKKTHGRDITANELENSGFDQATIKEAVRQELIVKYQVTVSTGSTENRYKLQIDWKSINK